MLLRLDSAGKSTLVRRTACIAAIAALFVARNDALAHDDPAAHAAPTGGGSSREVATEMAEAAQNWLNALDAEQRRRSTFLFQDQERRTFHYFPIPRCGLPLKDMTQGQRHLAHALLATGLSTRGYLKTSTIMSLGDLLREMRPDTPNPFRDADQYFLTIFGKPGPEGSWGWRFEGFHVSLHFTLRDGEVVAASPSFLGVHPATVPTGPRQGLRTLPKEEDLGRALAVSLTPEQRAEALGEIPDFLTETVGGLVTGNVPKVENFDPTGIPAARLDKRQQAQLWELIAEYAHKLRPALAERDLARIAEAGLEKIYFRWDGSLEPGQGHHYIIQGPTFLVEYDNTQDAANHVHCIWRDLTNDFGGDPLRNHYQLHHRKSASAER